MLFIVVDAHSKWPEVYPMKSITAGETIKVFAKDFYISRVTSAVVE